MLRKTRHLVDFAKIKFMIIFIDHDAALNIAKQINMIITSTNKLNLRLIRASDYIQRFELKFRHRSEKQHVVFDVLFRLFNTNAEANASFKRKLNALFIIILMKMNEIFRKKIEKDYRKNLN